MNEFARKKARRAELEWVLLGAWKERSSSRMSFAEWLEREATWDDIPRWQEEVKELIALYEGGGL